MEYITFFNISPIQFFDSTQYSHNEDKPPNIVNIVADNENNENKDLYDIGDSDNNHIENIDIIDPTNDGDNNENKKNKDLYDIGDSDNNHIENIDIIDPTNDGDNNEIDMECFDDRDEDILLDPISPIHLRSKTLNISPNIYEVPIGITHGVIAKIPIVLAQLVIPLNISSSIDLPEKAIKIKDIQKRLRLEACTLLQPTNILFIKGFINRSIEYSTMNYSNIEEISGGVHHYTIDIPFECSTAINFFTQPLDPITNTKDIFQYSEMDSSEFNQISEEFFNEIPFCKLLSSKIVAFDKCLSPKESKQDLIKIQENMTIELRMEVLQNQPVTIVPAINNMTKT